MITVVPDEEKHKYMHLLLEGDEYLPMILKYLQKGSMYALFEDGVAITAAVVLTLDEETAEIKNIATLSEKRGKGYGTRMMEYILNLLEGKKVTVGTSGERNIRFYERFGFRYERTLKDFFSLNYPNPIIEDGIVIRDMTVLALGNRHKKHDGARHQA